MSQAQPRKVISPTEVGLKVGDRSSAVSELQKYLTRFGYLPLNATLQERLDGIQTAPTTGEFDGETEQALRAYQAFHGIPITGQLDEASVGQMAVARCGVPDIWNAAHLTFSHNRFVLSGRRWNDLNLNFAFENFTPDSRPRRIRNAVSAAFRTWSEVAPLRFHRNAVPSEDTEIRIRFAAGNHGDNNDFDGVGGTLAHGFYPPTNGVNDGGIAGDIHFDEAETWSTDPVVPADRYDLQTLATHEIGHALGLQHSTEPGAIMWGSFSLGTPKRSLHQDDIDGIQEIYTAGTQVPEVLEKRPAKAAADVRAAGLEPRFFGTIGPQSWVFSQSPRAGAVVEIGSRVNMTLRNGPRP